MNTVPADILLEIADYLSCPSEVLHLYLTVRPFVLLSQPTEIYITPSLPSPVLKNRRRAHPCALLAHRPARLRTMHPHARDARRTSRPRAPRPRAQRFPGLLSTLVPVVFSRGLRGKRGATDVQVGPRRAAGWVCGFVGRAARGAAPRGAEPFCVGWRGAAAVR
jgi:hypothetical protein